MSLTSESKDGRQGPTYLVWLARALVLLTFCLLIPPSQALVGDETFYFLQAQAILAGQFRWFDQTSTLLWPLLLAPFSFSVLAGRMLAVALGLAFFYLLGGWIKQRSSTETSSLAAALLLLHPQILVIFTSLYSEAVALVLIVAFLSVADRFVTRIHERPSPFRLFLTLGGLLALLLVSRFSAISLIIVLPLMAALASGTIRQRARNILLCLGPVALGVGALLLWIVISDNQLFQLKSSRGPDWGLLKQGLAQVPDYLGLALIAIGCVGATVFRRGYGGKLLALCLVAALVSCLTVQQLFPRYLFFLLIPLAWCGGEFLARFPWPLRWMAALAVAVSNFSHWSYPGPGLWNRYFLRYEGCENITQVSSSCRPLATALPIFDQPQGSGCVYQIPVETLYPQSFLYFPYVDDWGEVYVNGEVRGRFHALSPGTVDLQSSPGNSIVAVAVSNSNNIGGIGQVMLCDSPNSPSVRKALEEELESGSFELFLKNF